MHLPSFFLVHEQYGAPYNDDLYLHRLGRTGRAGQQGSGLLVLLPFETRFKAKLGKRNIVEASSGPFANVSSPSPGVEARVVALKQLVRSGHTVLRPSAESACTSFVAHYLEYAGDGASSSNVADAARDLADSFGLAGVPTLPAVLEAKLDHTK
jgi:ATP-dependent RNA helicase MSS116, mitochondrial